MSIFSERGNYYGVDGTTWFIKWLGSEGSLLDEVPKKSIPKQFTLTPDEEIFVYGKRVTFEKIDELSTTIKTIQLGPVPLK